MGRRNVVITGMGAVTAFGRSVEALWAGLLAGRPALAPERVLGVPRPVVMGRVPDGAAEDGLDPRLVRQTDRFIRFALVAAEEAVRQAGDPFAAVPARRVGVVLGNSAGGLETVREGTLTLERGGRLHPHFVPAFIPNLAAARIAIRFGLEGPNLTVSTACASGTDALGVALDWIRAGRADVVVTGGAESLLVPEMIGGLSATRAVSPVGDPEIACRPFDAHRSGMVMGEGAGILIFEAEETARARGARPLARVLGYGTHGDGTHPVAPAADGHGERAAMEDCLADAGLDPAAVDYINAHGTGTLLGDRIEWESIAAVVGTRPLVSSIKGATGHLLGAAGAVEAVVTVEALTRGCIPPTTGHRIPDPACPLRVVAGQAYTGPVQVALSNSFGFGGQNATIALARYEGSGL
ncbi:MAG: beta-ketoacyl-[acyl-carrier-protein] synthase family protein [Firmicutes bacterium]|nr:beta-ketoacyl-[acyl-carrier-protein] synthase family protein [Bacillota bacterium]